MQNLAGRSDADEYIRRELERSRITIEGTELNTGEVPYTAIGRLGPFTFTRAWYYWVVKGPMPLNAAHILYNDPIGVTDVRVAGDAGCSHPDNHITWTTPDGKTVVPKKEEGSWARMVEQLPSMRPDFEKLVFSDSPLSLGATPSITSYHIDSEVGLRLFADAIRLYVLDPEPATA